MEVGMNNLTVSENDPRYTLTPYERAEVTALKEMCDKEGVKYNSIFELAKFCLVSTVIEDAEKRHEDSFQRLKKRRLFEEKYQLDDVDIFAAAEELEKNIPGWAVSCGKVNGKWCVGYTSESSDPSYMNTAFKTICKVEITRFDLAASDLEEARNGFYIVGTGKDLKANPLKSIRVAVNLRVLFDKMHANRVKGIYYEVPKAIAVLSNLFLSVIPSKMKERMNLGKSLQEMKLYKEFTEEFIANMPPKLGGKYEQSLEDWIRERSDYRALTDELVKL